MSSLSSVIKGSSIAWATPQLLTVDLTLPDGLDRLSNRSIDGSDHISVSDHGAGTDDIHQQMTHETWLKLVKAAEDEAQAIVMKARKDAELYLKEAREAWEKEKAEREKALEASIQQRYEEAWEKGYKIGYDEGKKEAEIYLEAQSEKLQQMYIDRYEQLERDFELDLKDAYTQLFAFAFEIAEKLTFQSLQDDERLVAFAKEAILQAPYSETLKVALPPDDYPRLIPYRASLKNLLPEHTRLILYPNKDLSHGLLIESDSGIVDIDMAQQIKRFLRDLQERVDVTNDHGLKA